MLCGMIAEGLKIKARADKPGTIQRVSALIASRADAAEACATGAQAVKHAVEGKSGHMVTLERAGPRICLRDRDRFAFRGCQQGKTIPRDFINAEGNGVSPFFLDDVTPLIGDPLPGYARLERHFVKRLL